MDMSGAVIVNSSRLKSAVWNDFDRVKKGDTCAAICRHCKRVLSGSSTSGTSHLRNHLIRCRKRSNLDVGHLLISKSRRKEFSQTIARIDFDQELKHDIDMKQVNVKYEHDQARDGTVSGKYSFDQRQSQIDLALMIIMHGYPLNMVEHLGFNRFATNLQPLFELVPFDRVESDCMDIYQKEKQILSGVLDKLPGRISLGADIWAGSGDTKYLCLTGNYIDQDWQLVKKILNFIEVDDSDMEDMHLKIMACLLDWDIDRKLVSLTFDIPMNSNILVEKVRDRLCQNRFLLCNGEFFNVQCLTRFLNLMAQDAVDTLCETARKIRCSIQYIKSSQATSEKFKELVQKARICSQKVLPVSNTVDWQSTYSMFEAALDYKDAFTLLQGHDPLYTSCPSDDEWDGVRGIVVVLKLFVEIFDIFAEMKNPTANIYFPEICEMHVQLNKCCQNTDVYISSFASCIKGKLDDYWEQCGATLAVAAVLDPRFKMKLVEYYYPLLYGTNAQDRINDVTECVKALYNEHMICSPLASIHQGLTWHVGDEGEASGCLSITDSDGVDRLTGFDKFLDETSEIQNIQSDLDKYLEEPLFPRTSDINIFNWWKVHTPKYPIVSMMARNFLSIPLAISSDSTSNSGYRSLNSNWSSLDPGLFQAVMCAQDWMKGKAR